MFKLQEHNIVFPKRRDNYPLSFLSNRQHKTTHFNIVQQNLNVVKKQHIPLLHKQVQMRMPKSLPFDID